MGREDHLENVLQEARRDLWGATARFHNLTRFKGESWKHWRRRRKRHKHRVENREKVKDHLVKKLGALREEKAEEQAQHPSSYTQGGTRIVYFDGKSVVEDLAYWLERCRKSGIWKGVLVSGYRTPEYSESLCFNMCGQPSCPGRCAGRATNHAKTGYPGPAADVTDYINAERAMYAVGAPYFNDLVYDLVHLSRSGR